MIPSARGHARVVLAMAALAALALAAHFAILERFPPAVGAAISLLPLAAAMAAVLRRGVPPRLAAALVLLAAIAAWLSWGRLQGHFKGLFLVEHVTFNLVLAAIFGRTLRAGREPLCTTFARLLHGSIPPEVERYTRKVTVAWTVFFLAVAAVSVTLYAADLLVAWSLLANIGSPVLIGLMFAVEYAVRVRALPHWERMGILSGIRAFSRHFRGPLEQAPR